MKEKTLCQCGRINLVGEGCQCSTMKAASTNDYRKSTHERGYGSDWQALSIEYRRCNPLCEICLADGRTEAVAEVHHIVPIAVDPSLRLEWSNLMSVCRECHELVERLQAGIVNGEDRPIAVGTPGGGENLPH